LNINNTELRGKVFTPADATHKLINLAIPMPDLTEVLKEYSAAVESEMPPESAAAAPSPIDNISSLEVGSVDSVLMDIKWEGNLAPPYKRHRRLFWDFFSTFTRVPLSSILNA